MPGPVDTRGPRAWAALAPAVVLLAFGVWEIVGVARFDAAVPSEEDWAAAAGAVRKRHAAGDLIVFAPGWVDPIGRASLGDLIPIEMAARMDAARYAVIWEVAARGARAVETVGLEPVSLEVFGALAVRRFERGPAVVVTDFVAEAARVGAPAGRGTVSLEEVGFAPHRCILLVPRPGGDVTATFRDVELGSELVGHAGLADVFTRRDIRAPGRLFVAVDGEQVAALELGVDDGWVRFAAPTRAGRGTVVFQAGADARDRRVCIAAEARR